MSEFVVGEGALMKVRRELMGTSQNRLGDRLGVSGRTVAKWESGNADIPVRAFADFNALWREWVNRVDVAAETGGTDWFIYRSPMLLREDKPGIDMTWDEHTAFVKAVVLSSSLFEDEFSVRWEPEERLGFGGE